MSHIQTNRRRGERLLIAALLGSMTAVAAAAGDPTLPTVASNARSAAGAITPEQRLREELRVLLIDMVASGAFGDTKPEQIALQVDEPAQRVSNLGLLVDSAGAERTRDGLRVLGTTPGGSAERIGLRAGDVLVAVNDAPLAGAGAKPSEKLRSTVESLGDGAELRFDVRRDGRNVALAGPLTSVYVPAMRVAIGNAALAAHIERAPSSGGCGHVNIFDVAPRQEHLYAVRLIDIDGALPGTQGTTNFRLDAGHHSIKLAERIDSRQISFNDRQRNTGEAKTLSIDVAPGTTYYLAARLNVDHRTEWRDGAYWEPVVWKEAPEACR